MKIVTIVGARPQFIKAAMISRAIRAHNSLITNHQSPITNHQSPVTEAMLHTGQHYDYEMDRIFFEQLDITIPNHHLNVGSGTHGDQTGRMLIEIEKALLKEKPDAVLVFGDTNSTLAGALAAAKLKIPVGHVEAGMRSFKPFMPEEINRVVAGHVSKWHFCATETAVRNLKNEGITKDIHFVGDVMFDAVMLYKDVALEKSTILQRLKLITSHQSPITKYVLATVHRAENTDEPNRLQNIVEALAGISKDISVILPLHPRTKKALEINGFESLITSHQSLITTGPLPYIDMLRLEQSASVVITDSGGMQKEAYWLGVPCVTVRDETEWVETADSGMNRIAGTRKDDILSAVHDFMKNPAYKKREKATANNAAKSIINILVSELN